MRFKSQLFFIVLALASCTKSTPSSPTQVITHPTRGKQTYVYVSGNATSSQSFSVATWWKNGVAQALTDTTENSLANAMAASDTNIYIAGYAKGQAAYWKNGILNLLPGDYAQGIGIAASGNDVYVAGYTTISSINRATIWKNGTPTVLTDELTPSLAVGVAVVGTDVYAAGFLQHAGGSRTLCYWKNGTIHIITDDAISSFNSYYYGSTALAVKGTDVYVTGAVENEADNHSVATCWKNGTASAFVTDAAVESSGFNNIAVNGADVYMIGFDGYKAIYWLNGTPTALTNGQQQYTATAVTVQNANVYVAGFSGYNDTRAVYWMNGSLKTLPGGVAVTTGIAVVTK